MYSQLAKQRPPQPPPPPPTLPQNGNLFKPNSCNKTGIKNNDSRASNCIKIATIKPTTAGLLKFPEIEDNNMQQVSSNGDQYYPSNLMGSQLFKNELLQKQSRISNISSQSIDDRLKARKEEESNSIGCSDKGMVNDRLQINNIPEKLMSSLSREKQPFSYSVDVNDPNNKGKLDLTQIKSPIMRRRLLANMNSTEKSDCEDDESDLEHNNCDDDAVNIERNRKLTQRKLDSPTVVHYEYVRKNNQPITQHQGQSKPRPIIRYNEPPLFYNSVKNQKTTTIQDTSYNSDATTQALNSSSYNGYIDELNLEVAKSLDSLSMLVANLPAPEGSTNNRPNSIERHSEQDRLITNAGQYQRSQSGRRSTFLPHDYYRNSTEFNGHDSKSISPEMSHHTSNNRSIGDYLLSPNSDYFATSSTTLPYSISPYYGNTLEPEICNFNTHYSSKSSSSSGRTFSPINRSNNSLNNR